MSSLDLFVTQKLQDIIDKDLYRKMFSTNRYKPTMVQRNSREYISFSCNDYLGLSHHASIVKAAVEATRKYGAGSGASRLVTGNHELYAELEHKLADFKGVGAACVFGSGYLANIGVIPALVGKGDVIIADKLMHSCLLDGAKLSGAEIIRFRHNDMAHLAELLQENRGNYDNCLLITEGIFSMDGDIAPLDKFTQLAHQYDAWTMTDDAHAFGILGEGRGSSSHFGVNIDIQMGTLSKAAGSYGGYVCASAKIIEYIKNTARSLIFTTALPPAAIASAIAAIDVIQNNPKMTMTPIENAQLFCQELGIDKTQSQIVAVIVGDNNKALDLSGQLQDEGFLVTAIRPPTVPQNTARLRFTFCSEHKKEDIISVANLLKGLL